MLPNELFDFVKRGAAQVAEGFTRPDDDFEPMLFVATDLDGKTGVGILPLGWSNESEKITAATIVIPTVIRKLKSKIVCTLVSAWAVQLDPAEATQVDLATLRPSQHPARREVLVCSVFTVDRSSTWCAPIERAGDRPPKLGAWASEPAEGESTGLFIDPIREALRQSAN